MTYKENEQQANTPLSVILNDLITECGVHDEAARDSFVESLSTHTGIHRKTIKAWLCGTNKTMRNHSAELLTRYFKGRVPGAEPAWFHAKSFEAYKALRSRATRATVTIDLDAASPGYISRTGEDLPGVYVTYRYAFENTGLIAKELLHIRRTAPHITSTFYFRIKAEDELPPETLRESEGTVFLLGSTYFILGLTRNPDRFAEPRVRALLLKEQGIHYRLNKHRIGILLSSSRFTKEPCAVRVLLQKVKRNIDDIRTFAQEEVQFIDVNEIKRIFKKNYHAVLDAITNDTDRYILTLNTHDYVLRLSNFPSPLSP